MRSPTRDLCGSTHIGLTKVTATIPGFMLTTPILDLWLTTRFLIYVAHPHKFLIYVVTQYNS
jgi:hypothetical protein